MLPLRDQCAHWSRNPPNRGERYRKRSNTLANRPKLLGDCHTSVRAGTRLVKDIFSLICYFCRIFGINGERRHERRSFIYIWFRFVSSAMRYRSHGRRSILPLLWSGGNSGFLQNTILSAITNFRGGRGFPLVCAPWWRGQRLQGRSASGSPSATRSCPSGSSRSSPLRECRRQCILPHRRWQC